MPTLENLMWVEKYRPTTLNEIVNQKEIVSRLQSMLEKPAEMPHLLFVGPAGTGKTTAALCIARQVMGDYWRDYTLNLNASDERGIDVVRERVKIFARYSDHRVGIPFRIVILDEADEMTSGAQTALRRIMEETSRVSRFILIGNYLSNIIEPIQSRCVVFKFARLSEEDMAEHLASICSKEGVKTSRSALRTIYELSSGDMRHAINLLQAAASFGEVSTENVKKTAGISARARVSDILKLALDGEFMKARDSMMELTKVYGMSESDFLRFLSEEVYKLDHTQSSRLSTLLAEYDFRLIQGGNPDIQLSALLAELAAIGRSGRDTK